MLSYFSSVIVKLDSNVIHSHNQCAQCLQARDVGLFNATTLGLCRLVAGACASDAELNEFWDGTDLLEAQL